MNDQMRSRRSSMMRQILGYIDPGGSGLIIQVLIGLVAISLPIGGLVALVVWLQRRGRSRAEPGPGTPCPSCAAMNFGEWSYCTKCGEANPSTA